tara:strand:- start:1348 stop:1881 length:534 start_codon:yes stop_codon:yes gene_type:complete
MKDFANRNNKRNSNVKNKRVFRSKKPSAQTISSNTILFLLIICFGLGLISFLYFKTDVISIKPEDSINLVTIDFPTSLKEDSILIESSENISKLECEYFVQIGAYGNKKYALEAKNMLQAEIQRISINEIYSTLQSGKLLHSVISGPYQNKSSANNAKEKITKTGFDPRLRTLCKKK